MKPLAYAMLLCLATPFPALSQSVAKPTEQVANEIQLSPAVAEKLLIHKVEPKCAPSAARVIGTVVVHIGIGTHGEVLAPHIVSGPMLLRPSALDAIRLYKYKPYEINGKPVEVTTSVSIHYDLDSNCP